MASDAAEQGKQILEEKLAERLKFYQDIRIQIDELSAKKDNAERITADCKTHISFRSSSENVGESAGYSLPRLVQNIEPGIHINLPYM